MTLIIDYGIGNVASIANALRHLSIAFEISSNPDDLFLHRACLLIGVGNFGKGVEELGKRGLDRAIRTYVKDQANRMIGVCVGMQMLFEGSDEAPEAKGLSLLPGTLHKLAATRDSPVPNVGFSEVLFETPHQVTAGLQSGASFYFTHSYALTQSPKDCWIAHSCHGAERFVSAIISGNLAGLQFHPEKSQSNGLRLLANLLRN